METGKYFLCVDFSRNGSPVLKPLYVDRFKRTVETLKCRPRSAFQSTDTNSTSKISFALGGILEELELKDNTADKE